MLAIQPTHHAAPTRGIHCLRYAVQAGIPAFQLGYASLCKTDHTGERRALSRTGRMAVAKNFVPLRYVSVNRDAQNIADRYRGLRKEQTLRR
jgi:hypothetical protein